VGTDATCYKAGLEAVSPSQGTAESQLTWLLAVPDTGQEQGLALYFQHYPKP
jgi:hypothetical protein